MKRSRRRLPQWVRAGAYRLISMGRRLTWRGRKLPDFVIIGAQKTGTSSLFRYLRQHPQLRVSFRKEVHFFDGGLDPDADDFRKGQAWYRSHFPWKGSVADGQKVFEASPLYVFNPLAAKRIAELLPDAKLILVLRDPVERAISHYFHEVRKGREPLPLMEALQKEEERLAPALASEDYKSYEFIHYSYKSRGLYGEQLARYLEHFSMERILILSSEDMFADPQSTLRQVFEFVGVDPEFWVGNLRPSNTGWNRHPIEPPVYAYLQDYFRAPNQALYELIGRDLGW